MPLRRRHADAALDAVRAISRAAFFSSHPNARAPISYSSARTGLSLLRRRNSSRSISRLARHLVHREFQRETSLRPSGRAHRRRRPGVDVNVAFLGADIGASIDRLERARTAGAAADSAAAMLTQFDRGQLAVAIDAHLAPSARNSAGCRSRRCSAARGSISLTGAPSASASCAAIITSAPRAELRAETAAQIFADHAHVVRRQAELHRQIVAHGKYALRRAPDRQLIAGRIEARDRAVGFERRRGSAPAWCK